MPANLSPEYKNAQEAFRRARDPQEKLECLREMLRVIPKHKGTEHLQADIKTRIKEQGDELGGPKKGAARGGPELAIRPEGAGQVALVGPANAGKSALHARLTGSHAVVGPWPFSTKFPVPGMLIHEDVQFQLVDLPPVTEDYMEPWMGGALQNADAVLVVMDLSDADCVDQLEAVERRLREKKVDLLARLPHPGRGPADPSDGDGDDGLDDPFRVRLPALLLASKADLYEDPEAELQAFRELAPDPFVSLVVSTEGRSGSGRHRPGAVRAARGRARVLENSRSSPGREEALHVETQRDGAGRGPAGPPGARLRPQVRAGVRLQRRVRGAAGERGLRGAGQRHRRAALVKPQPR